jgi:uncharacterized membrane protein
MTPWILAYGATLLLIGVFDAIWLGWLAKDFYQTQLAALLEPQVRWLPALLFYLGYPLGVLGLALNPMPQSWAQAVGRSAFFGLMAYATYDLSNWATLKTWNGRIVLVDTAWGMVLSAAAGAVAYAVLLRFKQS